MRLALEIATAVRAEWPEDRPLFCRVSSVDGAEGGWGLDDSVVLARELGDVRVDVIDCSSGGLTEETRQMSVPRGLGFQVPFARRIREETGLLTQAVGMILDGVQAEEILRAGDADLIAVGREALYEPSGHTGLRSGSKSTRTLRTGRCGTGRGSPSGTGTWDP